MNETTAQQHARILERDASDRAGHGQPELIQYWLAQKGTPPRVEWAVTFVYSDLSSRTYP